MKILVLSRLYWPDTVSVAQHLGDLTFALAEAGHEVSVLTSRYAYEDPGISYPPHETQRGVAITRLRHPAVDKRSKLKRILDFMVFNGLILWRLLWMPRRRYDLLLGLTNPPLLSFIGVLMARIKGMKFCYWTMDLQPELAIQAGYLKQGSFSERGLTWMGNYIFRHSDLILTLDRFMAEHIVRRGGKRAHVAVLPPWPVVPERYTGSRLENPFRQEHGFGNRIVVMYSGNHAVVHPLDTLLEAALALRGDPRFLFVFIGGGVRKQDVTDFKARHQLDTILQLPYQPRERIHLSLGSADLQVVILGDGHTGFTHPNKIYGAMYLGKPILYIGPSPSHVTEILAECPGNLSVTHGAPARLAEQLQAFAALAEAAREAAGEGNRRYALEHFDPERLLAQHTALFGTPQPARAAAAAV